MGTIVLFSLLFYLPFLTAEILPRPLSGAIYPSPEPFTLGARAAQVCINLLREEMFLLHAPTAVPEQDLENLTAGSINGSGKEIVKVYRVWARQVDLDTSMPPGHRRRYIIEVNGKPLEMSTHFIEWDGRMTNLQLLFTYRNQYPPRGLEYSGRN